MKRNSIYYSYIILLQMLFFMVSCENKEWDKHYDEDAGRGDQKINLVDAVRSNGYTACAAALEKLKFDVALNSGMPFTLFVLPDDIFNSATQGMTDEQLSAYLLNTILPGKYLSSDFKDQYYQPIDGDIFSVSMQENKLINLHNETVQITQKDIILLNSVLFEITGFLPQYPDWNIWLKENGYTEYLSFLEKDYSIDSTYSEKRIGITDTGLKEFTVYPRDFYTPADDEMKNLVFVVPDNNSITAKIIETENLISSFFKEAAEEKIQLVIEEFQTILLDGNGGTYFKNENDSIILVKFSGASVSFPDDEITQQVKLRNGNILLISNLILNNNWKPVEEILWNFNKDRTGVETIGECFEGKNLGDWCNYVWTDYDKDKAVGGEKIIYTFPAETLYTTEYEVEFRYQNAKDWPVIKFYVNGEYLDEVDLRNNDEENKWDGACERNGNKRFMRTVKIEDYTRPVTVTLENYRNWQDTGGELMAPFNILFRIKE